jgi:hypothetical protein
MSSRYGPKGKGHDATGRTKGAEQHHVRLYKWFTDSPAWRALTPAQRCVYLEVELRFFGTNNGKICLSARTAAEACNINKDTANKALHHLTDLGFIECATPGGFSTNSCKAPEWRLTRVRCDVTGEPASKAFMRWRPTAKASPKIGTVLSENKDSRPRKCA